MNRDVFPAVEPESPVSAALSLLRQRIAADPGLRVDGSARVRADLLPRRGDGGIEVGRFYWSVQRPDRAVPLRFRARTLFHDRTSRATTVRDFPDDPAMGWLPDPDGPLETHRRNGATVHVLRYIPLRRTTFLLTGAAGLPPRVVGKSQARSGLQQAVRVLEAVHRALPAGDRTAFSVPRLLDVDLARRLLYLEELPGRPLSRVHEQDGTAEAMSRLGRVHRQLHELDVSGLDTRRADDWLASAATAADRIATLLPSLSQRVLASLDALASSVPDDGELAFCQGDFVPSQILCDRAGWSVLDLDDGHLADPYAEVAALYTALPRELSVKDAGLADRVRELYLAAYLSASGRRLDRERWRWYLAVARLRLLARRLVKGRAVPGEAQALLAEIESARLPLQQ